MKTSEVVGESGSRSVMSDSVTPWTIHTVHGILQARIPEWIVFPFSRGIFPTQGSNPGLPPLQVDSLPSEPQGKSKNTGVDSLSLLQWIFPTQGLNPGLLHCRRIPYQLSYQGMTVSGRKRTSTVDSFNFKDCLYN